MKDSCCSAHEGRIPPHALEYLPLRPLERHRIPRISHPRILARFRPQRGSVRCSCRAVITSPIDRARLCALRPTVSRYVCLACSPNRTSDSSWRWCASTVRACSTSSPAASIHCATCSEAASSLRRGRARSDAWWSAAAFAPSVAGRQNKRIGECGELVLGTHHVAMRAQGEQDVRVVREVPTGCPFHPV